MCVRDICVSMCRPNNLECDKTFTSYKPQISKLPTQLDLLPKLARDQKLKYIFDTIAFYCC